MEYMDLGKVAEEVKALNQLMAAYERLTNAMREYNEERMATSLLLPPIRSIREVELDRFFDSTDGLYVEDEEDEDGPEEEVSGCRCR